MPLFLLLFVHSVFVLECLAPGFLRLIAPHRATTNFSTKIHSPLKLQKAGRLSHSLLMQPWRGINNRLSSNHWQVCLESPSNLLQIIGRFPCPLLIHSNHHASPWLAEAQNCSAESATWRLQACSVRAGPVPWGIIVAWAMGPFLLCRPCGLLELSSAPLRALCVLCPLVGP